MRWADGLAEVVAVVAALAAGAALISATAVTAIDVVVNATRWLRRAERLSMQSAFPKGTPTSVGAVMVGLGGHTLAPEMSPSCTLGEPSPIRYAAERVSLARA